MSYPIVQTGSLTLPSGVYNLKIAQVTPRRNTPLFTVAGSGDTHNKFVQGISVEEYIGTGYIKETGAETYGLSQSSTMTLPSTLDVKAQNWRVRRKWSPIDVTGSGDATKEYAYGLPSTSLSVGGVAKTGYVADHTTESITVSTVMSQFGTLSGTLKIAQKGDMVSYVKGGVPMVQFGGEFSDHPTFTPLAGTPNDLAWAFGTAIVAPIEGTMTLDAGDTTDLTPNVMVYEVQVSNNARDGGSMQITCRMRTTI
ncbi:hypothetical protein N9878_01240 [bacterium]|nr:hypothetical protein [bacterium]